LGAITATIKNANPVTDAIGPAGEMSNGMLSPTAIATLAAAIKSLFQNVPLQPVSQKLDTAAGTMTTAPKGIGSCRIQGFCTSKRIIVAQYQTTKAPKSPT
jgi:hypothetical protein